MDIVIVVGTVDNVDSGLNPYKWDDKISANTTSWESRIVPDLERCGKTLNRFIPESAPRVGNPYLGDGHI